MIATAGMSDEWAGEMNVPDERGLKLHMSSGASELTYRGEMNVPDERGLKQAMRRTFDEGIEAR